MSCALRLELPAGRLEVERLRRQADLILRGLQQAHAELSLVIVDDLKMRGLNKAYRNMDRSTDVLAFPQDGLQPGLKTPTLLGDVVISLPTARRQARERHRSLHDELRRLLIHGVLHLLGHDHYEVEETRRMRAEERRLATLLRQAD